MRPSQASLCQCNAAMMLAGGASLLTFAANCAVPGRAKSSAGRAALRSVDVGTRCAAPRLACRRRTASRTSSGGARIRRAGAGRGPTSTTPRPSCVTCTSIATSPRQAGERACRDVERELDPVRVGGLIRERLDAISSRAARVPRAWPRSTHAPRLSSTARDRYNRPRAARGIHRDDARRTA